MGVLPICMYVSMQCPWRPEKLLDPLELSIPVSVFRNEAGLLQALLCWPRGLPGLDADPFVSSESPPMRLSTVFVSRGIIIFLSYSMQNKLAMLQISDI